MTDDKKQKLDDYIQKVIDLINIKTDNFDKLYEFNGKYINYCDNEFQQAIILILGIVKDRKTYIFEKEDVRYFLSELIIKITSKYKETKKHLHEIQSQPNSKKTYEVMSNGVRIYIPSEEEKYIETIVNRQCYIIIYLENLIKREDNGKKSYFDDVEHYEKMIKDKQEFVKAKQEYLSLKNKKTNADKLITYIKENHREAFENIITKLNSANILQPLYDNIRFEYKWLGSVLDFTYFVALMNGEKFHELYLKEETKKTKGIQWQIFLNAFEVHDENGKLIQTSKECSNKYSQTFKSYRTSIDFNDPQNEKEPYLNCYKIHKIIKETNKYYFQR